MVTSTGRDLSVCGRNDCQDPNVTDQNLSRYEPTSETLVYILIGVTAGLVLLAIVVQTFFVINVHTNEKRIEFSVVEDISDEVENNIPSSNKQVGLPRNF